MESMIGEQGYAHYDHRLDDVFLEPDEEAKSTFIDAYETTLIKTNIKI